jgi:CheY-like chemotaxis protein
MSAKNGITILVVEDDLLLRERVAEFLHEKGLRTIEAGNAAEALIVLKEHPEIRLLFTDVTMPGKLDGCDLAEEIHASRPDIRIILTSGKRLPGDCHIPPDGVFVPKPYLPDQIVGMITHMLA